MVKGTTEYLQVGITPELKDKVNKFCSIKGNTKNKLINDLLTEFFNNKIVSNDYITLDKPLYFNMEDLLNNKSVVATINKPTNKFNEYMKVVNVPNNLDTYNKNNNSYCYDAPNTHKGILINCLLDKNHENLSIHYLGFIYNTPTNKPTLKISLINENELLNFLDIKKDNKIFKELKTKEKDIKKAISIDNNNFYKFKKNFSDISSSIPLDFLMRMDKYLKDEYNYFLIKIFSNENGLNKVYPIFYNG